MRRFLLGVAGCAFFPLLFWFIADGVRKDSIPTTTYLGSFVYAIAFAVPIVFAVGALAALLRLVVGERNRLRFLLATGLVGLGLLFLTFSVGWYPKWFPVVWAGAAIAVALTSTRSQRHH